MTSPETYDNGETAPAMDLIDAARRQVEAMRERRSHSSHSLFDRIDDRSVAASLPGYEIGGEIHRGGQGVVYQAVQSSTGRTVAIKMMRQGRLASRNQTLRLEREVQILGSLNHPNIVGVLDSGSSDDHHYFVMDYVDGRPLDVHAAELDRREILELFARICDAVHAAHLRGVIHRDLKPSNILIDRSGSPNILDFGLAKLLAGDDDGAEAHTAVTITGQFVGSLPWASPEQAAGRGSGDADDAIDIRSDVYSLGVMLYQVLTGEFPYRVIGSMRDVLDNIITAQPAPLSQVDPEIDDEIDTIVLKCLCKEPARRYQSAGELARDLRHYLANEPIEAKRDSFGYLLHKQLHRHRAAVAVAAGFFLLIAAGVGISLNLWHRAALERDQKESQRVKAESVNSILRNMLASANPEISSGRDVTVVEVLGNAASAIEAGSLRAHPEVEAAVRQTLGESYLALGKLDAAEHHLAAALQLHERVQQQDHPDAALCLAALGRLADLQGDQPGAIADLEKALSILHAAPQPRYEIPSVMLSLARPYSAMDRRDDAQQLLEQALATVIAQRGENHPETARIKVDVSSFWLGRDEALPLLQQALESYRATLGPKHPEVVSVLRRIGTELHMKSRYAESEATYLEALDLARDIYGPAHPQIITIVLNLDWLYQNTGQLDKRTGHLRKHQPAALATYGRDSLHYASFLSALGRRISESEDPAPPYEGEAMVREALTILQSIGAGKSWQAEECRNQLARFHLSRDELDQAEALLREAIAVAETTERFQVRRAVAQSLLGELLIGRTSGGGGGGGEAGRFEEAEQNLLASLESIGNRPTYRAINDRTIEQLIKLYETWNAAAPDPARAASAERWRQKRGNVKTD